jgi:hypothetical protein
VKKSRASSVALYSGLTLMLALSIAPALMMAQDPQPIVGDWSGTLNPGGRPKKHIVVHISAAQDGTLSGTIDYPDQDVSGTVITAITYRKSTLHFESTPSLTVYDGTMNQDKSSITGTMKQASESLDLVLRKTP